MTLLETVPERGVKCQVAVGPASSISHIVPMSVDEKCESLNRFPEYIVVYPRLSTLLHYPKFPVQAGWNVPRESYAKR